MKKIILTVILLFLSTFSMLPMQVKAIGDDSLAQSYLWQGHGGYVASGVGMWLQGGTSASGEIAVSGIPDGAIIEATFLYWCTWEEISPPCTSITVNEISITEELIGTVTEIDPLWPQGTWPHTYRGYRADVSSIVMGNGIYQVSGFPTGTEYDRQNTMGASIVVIYSLLTAPLVTIVINDGMVALHARPQSYTTTLSGFVAPPSPEAHITYIAGQAESIWNLDWEYFNGQLLAQNGLDGSDGPLWDTDTYDISSYVIEGDTSATVKVAMEDDWIGWVAAIFQIRFPPSPPVALPVIGKWKQFQLFTEYLDKYRGKTFNGYHSGEDWDFLGNFAKATIYSIAPGKVVKISPLGYLGSLGYLIAIEHTGPFIIPGITETSNSETYQYPTEIVMRIYSIYVHVTPKPGLKEGQSVGAGEEIAILADISKAKLPPHLHFEIRHPDQTHSDDWSLVGSQDNWQVIPNTNTPNGYYRHIQPMVDGGVRHPSEFIDANR